MKRDWNERDFRDLFHALRREDERLAPSFAGAWGAAAARLGTMGRPWRALRGAAAATAALAVTGALVVALRPSLGPPGSGEFMSAWRSPTRFLLRSPDETLLRTVPRLGAPGVEISPAAPDDRDGGAK